MNFRSLSAKNVSYFSRSYKLGIVATVIAVAVVVGSITVGDSVRATLLRQVDERLGDIETVVAAQGSFLDEAMLGEPLLRDAQGVLLCNGFISSHGKLVPVTVWGVDGQGIAAGEAKLNPALAEELRQAQGSDVALRLPSTGLVPSGSLFVSKTYTTSLRLSLAGLVEVEDGGNISLKNEQMLPFNLFVNRAELAAAMGLAGKVNLILSPKRIAQADFEAAWRCGFSGLRVRSLPGSTVALTSDRIFLQREATAALMRTNPTASRIFSYLANGMEANGKSIPYSFVTAVEGSALAAGGIILSDYAAERLHAKVGDAVRLTYFTSHDLKTLREDTTTLRVQQVVPLATFLADSTLRA
ncbi:MAG: ABC transporter permease, partial [Prevotellaceae bacterium]|nr:ABC transporter permease [Prevotellaceae bacterium]